jgi:hypothetical protein
MGSIVRRISDFSRRVLIVSITGGNSPTRPFVLSDFDFRAQFDSYTVYDLVDLTVNLKLSLQLLNDIYLVMGDTCSCNPRDKNKWRYRSTAARYGSLQSYHIIIISYLGIGVRETPKRSQLEPRDDRRQQQHDRNIGTHKKTYCVSCPLRLVVYTHYVKDCIFHHV